MKSEPWLPVRVWQPAPFTLAALGPKNRGRSVGQFLVPGLIGFFQELGRFSRARSLQSQDRDGPKSAHSHYSHFCVNATDMPAVEPPGRLATAPEQSELCGPLDGKPIRTYARSSLLRRSPEARGRSSGGFRVSLFRRGVSPTQKQ